MCLRYDLSMSFLIEFDCILKIINRFDRDNLGFKPCCGDDAVNNIAVASHTCRVISKRFSLK